RRCAPRLATTRPGPASGDRGYEVVSMTTFTGGKLQLAPGRRVEEQAHQPGRNERRRLSAPRDGRPAAESLVPLLGRGRREVLPGGPAPVRRLRRADPRLHPARAHARRAG